MLYGRKGIKSEIMDVVEHFERANNVQVIFGSVLGSISKGMERADSDYDTKFLYVEKTNGVIKRWDKNTIIKENDIHQNFVPENKTGFYDKVAFWEATSFLNLLNNPCLDDKISTGLCHFVYWTFNSPYCYDPFGLAVKINPIIKEIFNIEYELDFYRKYIQNTFSRKELRLREYMNSAYYALAIEYILNNNTFAPIYFPTLLMLCKDQQLKIEIKKITDDYYQLTNKYIKEEQFSRQMGSNVLYQGNDLVSGYIETIMEKVNGFIKEYNENHKEGNNTYDIVQFMIDEIENRPVRDVSRIEGHYEGGLDYRVARS